MKTVAVDSTSLPAKYPITAMGQTKMIQPLGQQTAEHGATRNIRKTENSKSFTELGLKKRPTLDIGLDCAPKSC